MLKKTHKIIGLVMCFVLILSLTACGDNKTSTSKATTDESNSGESALGSKQDSKDTKSSQLIELPVMFTDAGNDSGTLLLKKLTADFNEKYKGKYELKVEWIPGLDAERRSKLKMLNAAGNLPALVTDLAFEPAFGDLLIKNNRLMDLKPYFDASPEWKSMCIEESIQYNTTKDNKIFTAPATWTNYVGIFYNKELFEKAGITEFPKDWDSFWVACENLKASGITPISLHTTETGWCPMLMAESYMGTRQDGQDFMRTKYPVDFDIPVVNDAMELVKRLFSYSTPDAVGGNYALAANNFCSGKTAMIPNGPWMIATFSDPKSSPEGFDQKVGYAAFPGGITPSDLGMVYGDGVSMDHPIEVREGVVEWLKFNATPEVVKQYAIRMGYLSPKIRLTDAEKAELGPVMKEYVNMIEGLKGTVPKFQNQWDPITQNETIPTQLPLLIMNKMTVKQFCEKMTESAKKYKQQNN